MSEENYKYAGKGDLKDQYKLPSKPPKGLELVESSNQLLLTKEWKNPMGYILLIFSIVWTAFASVFVTSALSSLDGLWFLSIPFLLVPLVFVALGLWMFYVGLQFIYNRSTIKVEEGQVFIETRPFARYPHKSLYKHEIKQIFVKRVNFNSQKETINAGPPIYSIYYIDQHGKTQPFFWGFKFLPVAFPFFGAAEGKYFERKIEDFLSIKDADIKTYSTNEEQLKTPVYNEQGEEIGLKDEDEQTTDVMPIPASLEVEESAEGLFIFREWRSPMAIFLFIFGLVWSSIVGPMVYFVFSAIGELGAGGIFIALFMLPFIAVGLGMIYAGIATWVNTSTIHLDRDYLRVSHQPLPWKGSLRIPRLDIENIDVRTETRRGKNGSYLVTLLSITQRGKNKPISINYGNLNPNDEECLFIEYKLKQFLNRK